MRTRIAAAFAHAFLVRLTLIALLVGAALPVGWMPNADGLQSGVPFVMCTGHGPVTAIMDHSGKPAVPADSPSSMCVFAAAIAQAAPVAAPTLVVPQTSLAAPERRQKARALVRLARYRPQAARAPPLAA